MGDCAPKIVVAGDVCVDWLHWHSPAGDEGQNWELYEGAHWAAAPGGALLLAAMLRQAEGATILAPGVEDAASLPPSGVLESFAELEAYPATGPGDRRQVYRIARYRGYGCRSGGPRLLPVGDDDPAADLVVLDDAGNCFREAPEFWPAALGQKGASPIVVYKMARPLLEGSLWKRVRQGDPERLVIVVNADHLRAFGVNISRRLSWERTAKDIVWQMACNPALTELANARHLVIRLGLEGVLRYSSGPGGMVARLFFDPGQIEGGTGDTIQGQMQGYSDAFVAALALNLVCPPAGDGPQDLDGRLGSGILAGLRAARKVLELGYGQAGEAARAVQAPKEEAARMAAEIGAFPRPEILRAAQEGKGWYLAEVQVPNPTMPEPPDPDYWCILKDVQGAVLEEVAEDLVRKGQTEALRGVPLARFGRLRTADRAEIEGLRTIRNLMDEYLTGEPTRPLSIAVFGFPGSGKSFSVTEVARSASQRRVETLEFNLSQFRSPDDLTRAFHVVQDKVLEGVVPLVFFDEFDTPFDGELGWLKYFLAPMQDGKFRDGEAVHPIGKAIFVFAGGTCHSFQAFAHIEQPAGATEAAIASEQRFRAAKGPDFVSRLRGHVNILGPNPVDENDASHVVRRAMLLRSLVERKARQILDSRGQARIDEGLLRALLRVPQYRHGARSMEAILDMSMLSGRRAFEQAALPPGEQMALHVDADVFTRLMLRDALLGAAREQLGEAVHEHYRLTQKETKSADDPAMLPWGELDEKLRESCRQQADSIESKLRRIGCSLRPIPAGRKPATVTFTAGEIEVMAEMEHERWMGERRLDGWVLGKERDTAHRVSPWLVAWKELPDAVRQWDRNAVVAIPAVVALARFEVYRMGRG